MCITSCQWQGVYSSQGIVVLQLGVDVLHFPLSLLQQPSFFCFRQDSGFHPLRLLHLQQNHEQLQTQSRCDRVLKKVKARNLTASKQVTSRYLFYFAKDL